MRVVKSLGVLIVVVPAMMSTPVHVQPCHELCVHQPGGLPVIMPPVPPVGAAPLEPPVAPPVPLPAVPPVLTLPEAPPVPVPPAPVPPVPTHVPVGTQAAPHASVFTGQAHVPLVQSLPPLHTLPHAPQFV